MIFAHHHSLVSTEQMLVANQGCLVSRIFWYCRAFHTISTEFSICDPNAGPICLLETQPINEWPHEKIVSSMLMQSQPSVYLPENGLETILQHTEFC